MTHSVLQRDASSSFAHWYELYDPLILDLEGNGISFSTERSEFDLDGDGEQEAIPCLDWGCGFLAYDQNQDGIVNNGLELFGTVSGNGFEDLAQYDLDGNNWIDENDAIFDELSLWRTDETGADSLVRLADAEVGALYLGHVDTSFDLHDDQNNLSGRITGSGIYLKENGEVQSVHQVDVVMEPVGQEAPVDTGEEAAAGQALESGEGEEQAGLEQSGTDQKGQAEQSADSPEESSVEKKPQTTVAV